MAVVVLVAWGPVAVAGVIDRLRSGSWDPLLLGAEVHARCFVAIPLFLAAERFLEVQAETASRYLLDTGIVRDAQRPEWSRYVARLSRIAASGVPELLGTVLAYAATFAAVVGSLPDPILRWLAYSLHERARTGAVEPASYWCYVLIAQPLLFVLLFRFLFRWALYTRALHALARMDPVVRPAHADDAGGLAVLASPLAAFRICVLGASVSLVSVWSDQIARSGVMPVTFAGDVVAFLLIALAIALAPFLPLTLPMFREKRRAVVAHAALVQQYVDRFERKWLAEETPPMLGHPDFQSLADIGNSYVTLRDSRITPVSLDALKRQVAAALLPVVIVLLVHGPSTVQLGMKLVGALAPF